MRRTSHTCSVAGNSTYYSKVNTLLLASVAALAPEKRGPMLLDTGIIRVKNLRFNQMKNDFDIKQFHYDLPEDLIAQEPVKQRDASRLLVLDNRNNTLKDKVFSDIVDLFSPGDVLVVNDTRVFPARLFGKKATGGKVEFLALEYPAAPADNSQPSWGKIILTGLMKSSKAPKPGVKIFFGPDLKGEVVEVLTGGKVRMALEYQGNVDDVLTEYGNMPLPPYIKRNDGDAPTDRERYQTVYASKNGAVAAPTAGLHFTDTLLGKIIDKGVKIVSVTLHVGYGTFAPVRVDDIRDHEIHEEFVDISKEVAEIINHGGQSAHSIWVVGTTTARALEFAATDDGRVEPVSGWCGIYIYPGYRFKVVRNLITNFHLPQSSLLFMISALAGRQRIIETYEHAVQEGYRFYSYGDAMVIIT